MKKTLFGFASVMLALLSFGEGGNDDSMPDRYVDFIEANGTQYFDLGVAARCGTKADFEFAWREMGRAGSELTGQNMCLLGARKDGGDTRFNMMFRDHKFNPQPGYGTWYNVDGVTMVYDRREHFVADFQSARRMLMQGNAVVWEDVSTTYGELNVGLNLFLFACNYGGTANYFAKARCYGVKIWQDGVPVRNLKPCVKNGRGALYDSVQQEILYPRGGEVVYSCKPDSWVEYVESTGSQHVNTYVDGRAGIKARMDVMWPTLPETWDECFLGCRQDSGNTRFNLLSTDGGHRIYPGYGHFGRTENFQMESGVRYVIVSDFREERRSVLANGTEVFSDTSSTYGALDTQMSLYAFAQNNAGNVALPAKVRCYGLKIWEDDVLIRDFVPCVVGGRGALYERLSGSIFPSQGQALASYGRELTDAEAYQVSFAHASWNIGHYSRGESWKSAIASADGPSMASAYVDFLNGIHPDVLGIVEYSEEFTTDGSMKASESVFGAFDRKVIGPSKDMSYQWNCLFANSRIEVLGVSTNYFANHDQDVYCIVTEARLDDGYDISFVQTHLDWTDPQKRESQIDELISMFGGFPRVVISGDFNASRKDENDVYRTCWSDYGRFVRAGFKLAVVSDDVATCPDSGNVIDNIIVKGFDISNVKIADAGNLSDHRLVTCRLSFPEQAVFNANEPDGYVDFIEANGTQYFDLGVTARCGTKADFEFAWREMGRAGSELTGQNMCLLGARKDGGDTRFNMMFRDHRFNPQPGYGTWYNVDGVTMVYDRREHFVADFQPAKRTLVQGNAVVWEDVSATYGELKVGLNLFLFACNFGGTANYFAKARCYGVKIWQDGLPVRDLRPCVKNGRGALYDSVCREILYPQGGEVVYPCELDHRVEYIETTGMQYVNTYVDGRAGVKARMDVMWPTLPETWDECFLGCRRDSGDTRFNLLSTDGGHRIYPGYGYFGRTENFQMLSGRRYVIESDFAEACRLITVTGLEVFRDTSTTYGALNTEHCLYAFAQNYGGSASLHSRVRCYGLKIWQGDTLLRDFVPCAIGGSGQLYDRVSGCVFPMLGGGFVGIGKEVGCGLLLIVR